MAQKKKNSNYVTAKNQEKQAQKEALKQKQIRKENVKFVALCVASVLVIVGLILGIGAMFGMFEYYPKATDHASVTLQYGDKTYTLHIELYGEDAPEAVELFKKMAENGEYKNVSVDALIGGMLFCAEDSAKLEKISGEFSANGIKNKVKHVRGVVSMARAEDDYNSAGGRFFIVTEDNPELDGSYAAFGRVIDYGMSESIDEILKTLKVDENGVITEDLVIVSISVHEAH